MDNCTQNAIGYCKDLSALCSAPCSLLVTEPNLEFRYLDPNSFCKTCNGCDTVNTMHYGSCEAYRWNGKYVFYCPKGLIVVAAAIINEQNNLCGSMVVGPVVMGDIEDTIQTFSDKSLINKIKQLHVLDTKTVRHIEQILSAVATSVSSRVQNNYGNFYYEQEKLLSRLYEIKNEWQRGVLDSEYLIDGEKKLSLYILNKDKDSAQQLLNEMLGFLFFSGKTDFLTVKARLIEMLVVLSRAAIEAGAGIEEILLFNEGNIKQIEKLSSVDELSLWITVIMHRFIQYSFDFSRVKHSDVLYKIMQYVKANYNKKITLDDIAAHVYLSRSYISSMFKEQMGEGLFAYVNRVRVEKSKILLQNASVSLADVGGMCGFDDQSYFTKVFKSIVGVSPKKYRESRGRIEPQTKK